MDWAEVNTTKWRGHSTRGASASKAKKLGVALNSIMKQAGWKCSTSFANFYDKTIEIDPTEMAEAILDDV